VKKSQKNVLALRLLGWKMNGIKTLRGEPRKKKLKLNLILGVHSCKGVSMLLFKKGYALQEFGKMLREVDWKKKMQRSGLCSVNLIGNTDISLEGGFDDSKKIIPVSCVQGR
jgi:hypothetical protein